MTKPLSEPSQGRENAYLGWSSNQLFRRPAQIATAAIDLILVDVADPGAGNPADMYTVNTGKVILLRALSFLFTTDATVATRYPAIDIRDGSSNVFTTYLLTDIGQDGGFAVNYNFPGNDGVRAIDQTIGADTFDQRAIPDSLMKEDWIVRVFAGNIQAGDEFTNIRLLLQQFDAV